MTYHPQNNITTVILLHSNGTIRMFTPCLHSTNTTWKLHIRVTKSSRTCYHQTMNFNCWISSLKLTYSQKLALVLKTCEGMMRVKKDGKHFYWICTRRVDGVKCNKGKKSISEGTIFDNSHLSTQTILIIIWHLYIIQMNVNVQHTLTLVKNPTKRLSNAIRNVEKS